MSRRPGAGVEALPRPRGIRRARTSHAGRFPGRERWSCQVQKSAIVALACAVRLGADMYGREEITDLV